MEKMSVFFLFAVISFVISAAFVAYILFMRRPFDKRIMNKDYKLSCKRAPLQAKFKELNARLKREQRKLDQILFYNDSESINELHLNEKESTEKEILKVQQEINELKPKLDKLNKKIEKNKIKGDKMFLASNLQLFTASIFLSIVVMFLPVFYYNYELFGEYSFIRPILISIHTAIRTFILDGDFDTVANAVSTLSPEWQRVAFSAYAAVLYVLAPVLTLTNIVFLFKNIFLEFWIRIFYRNRPIYIMSELNVCSMAMAESIVNDWIEGQIPVQKSEEGADKRTDKKSGQKPVIIFTDVFEQNEEDDYELLLRARKIRAHCLKKDISHLDLSKRKARTEIFLIGECESGDNEAENIEHAIKLTRKYNNKNQFSIYVYAASSGSSRIIDSLEKGENTISRKFREHIENKPDDIIHGKDWRETDICLTDGFYIRRINSVESLVRDTLNNVALYKSVLDFANKPENNKTISIMIIGMGKYGKQFFKTALWFYQLYGYKLEINVFDADKYGFERIVRELDKECPELISVNPSKFYGDANYDIKFFSGIDCFTSDFDKCFDNPESAERLKRTSLAFVTLGDDDKNIEAAVMLRELFDRKKSMVNVDVDNEKANFNELPIIHAVVYDEQRASNLAVNDSDENYDADNDGTENNGTKNKSHLINHRKQPYHIKFIGNRISQYNYKEKIEKIHEIEKDAFAYHVDWMRKESQLRKCYVNNPVFKAAVDANQTFIYWGDSFIFKEKCERKNTECKDCDLRDSCELRTFNKKKKKDQYAKIRDVDTEYDTDTLIGTASEYFGYEYYRRSSISKSIHKKMIESVGEDVFGKDSKHNDKDADICTCRTCELKRITEHMRWNAYMRAEGFVRGARNDRAKTHPNLCTWNELPYLDRFKD